MIGDGPVLADCRRLASDLGIEDGVTFLGAQPPSVVREELRKARCLVQHSVEAASGDSRGRDPGLAGRLGRAARLRVEGQFSIDRSIGELWRIIQSCARA
jgi:glycosyltransferase involved in cell wall biosynthesis